MARFEVSEGIHPDLLPYLPRFADTAQQFDGFLASSSLAIVSLDDLVRQPTPLDVTVVADFTSRLIIGPNNYT